METKTLTTHIPLQLAEKIDQIAQRIERSRSWVIKQALNNWIDQEEERRNLTLEAMKDIDIGKTIDHSSVQLWANSLNTNKVLPTPY